MTVVLDQQIPYQIGTKDIVVGETTLYDMPIYLNAVTMAGKSSGVKAYEWTAFCDIGLGEDNYIWFYGWNRGEGEYDWAVTDGDPEDAIKILLGL